MFSLYRRVYPQSLKVSTMLGGASAMTDSDRLLAVADLERRKLGRQSEARDCYFEAKRRGFLVMSKRSYSVLWCNVTKLYGIPNMTVFKNCSGTHVRTWLDYFGEHTAASRSAIIALTEKHGKRDSRGF